MRKRFLSGLTAAVLAAAIAVTAVPFTAFADEVVAISGSELTPVAGDEAASSVIAVGTSGIDSAAEGITGTYIIAAGTSGIDSAAVGTSGSGTAAAASSNVITAGSTTTSSNVITAGSTTSSSGVIVAGGSSRDAGPNASDGAAANNVIVAGSSGSGLITTEGEKSNTLYSDILGGATLIMFHSETGRQILSCMIVTNNGSIIMVDGGYGEDAAYLTSQIVARGGHVSAWLITHPHADHAGALYTILQNEDARYAQGLPAQVTVDAIYYALGDESWYILNDPDEATMASALIGEFSGVPSSVLHPVKLGDTFQIDTAIVQVLNNRYDQASSNKGNNAGIVYKVTVNGVSILFLGDLAQEGADHMLAYIDPSLLKSDIVQVSHHGQADLNETFYQYVRPVICLWPTTDYMWADPGVTYTVDTVKRWMANLGVQRNYCMKDGDQTIR